jgi:peptidylprolyl isomerase
MIKNIWLALLLSTFVYAAHPVATLKTTHGDITIELRPDIAPKAVENFMQLAKKGYYDNTVFHRIIRSFMIQGGDPTGTGAGGNSIWGTPFADEFKPNVTFDRAGILAMANRGPHTNGSQFFITVRPTPHLNGRHTIFGYVLPSTYATVKQIEAVQTDAQGRAVRGFPTILSISIK